MTLFQSCKYSDNGILYTDSARRKYTDKGTFMLTTKEAAEQLGVTQRRVLALIASGELEAQRFGSTWAVQEESVQARLETPRIKGRPKLGEKDPRMLKRYTLMNQNTEVFDFVVKASDLTIGEISEIKHREYAPLGALSMPGRAHKYNLENWIRCRSVPAERPQLASLLRKFGARSSKDLLFQTLGFNLSDQYWFKPEDSTLTWHDLNYFENEYTDQLGLAMLGNEGTNLKQANLGPSAATPGILSKWWECKNGINYLYKGGDMYEREPYNELLATYLYQRLLDSNDYVPYELEVRNKHSYSKCPCFITNTTELVTMADVMNAYARFSERYDYKTYVKICKEFGVSEVETQLSKMIVCDFLTANADRHDQNLGLIRNVQTLQWQGVAPLYDNGRAFYYSAGIDSQELTSGLLHYQSTPFSEYPTAQLSLAEDYSWYDPQKLKGFDEIIREVLGKNLHLTSTYIDAVVVQFEKRVERVNEMARERRL